MTDAKQVKEAGQRFVERFGVTQTPIRAVDIVLSEIREVSDEARYLQSDIDDDKTRARYLEELWDVITASFNAMLAAEATDEEIADAAQRVIDKNNAKIHETHKVNPITRKIERRKNV